MKSENAENVAWYFFKSGKKVEIFLYQP